MTARQDPEGRDPESASSRLKQGLKSCHFILDSYRAKLICPPNAEGRPRN